MTSERTSAARVEGDSEEREAIIRDLDDLAARLRRRGRGARRMQRC